MSIYKQKGDPIDSGNFERNWDTGVVYEEIRMSFIAKVRRNHSY